MVAFWEERALPSGVVGPWDLAPLAREAARARADFLRLFDMLDSFFATGGTGVHKWKGARWHGRLCEENFLFPPLL